MSDGRHTYGYGDKRNICVRCGAQRRGRNGTYTTEYRRGDSDEWTLTGHRCPIRVTPVRKAEAQR